MSNTVRVKVPATTANLGPGFDALGLALDLWNEAEFTFLEHGRIEVAVHGEGEGQLPTDKTNEIARAALQVFALAGQPAPGLLIECVNRIPLRSGLGSSAAATLTGMLGANAILGNPLATEAILRKAAEREGHPDNAASAMLGGLVVAADHDGELLTANLPVTPLHVSVVLPEIDVPTRQARAVLPAAVPHADAVANLSGLALVVEAFRRGDVALLARAMQDRLHQPYRLPLYPGAEQALEAARSLGAAAALSGAGPSVVAFSENANPEIGKQMQAAFRAAGLRARVFELAVSERGAEVA